MPTQSPPDNGDGDTGSANADLPENQSNQSADEQQDASRGNSQDGNTNPEPQNNESPQDGDSSDANDDELAKFAKSRGYDLSDMSEREIKLLKDVRANQQEARSKKDEAKTEEELKNAAHEAFSVSDEEIEDDDPAVAESKITRAEVAQLRAENRLNTFFQDNPDARDYQDDMRDVLVRTIENDGKEAGRYLTKNLKTLLAIAKEERGDYSGDTAREEGRRAEREELRRKSEASAGTGHAASQSTSRSPKIDKNWVENTYDPTNEEHRNMLDAAIARGDLY